MQCIFRKENVGKALKYRLYRHLTRFEKIIKILMSFSSKIRPVHGLALKKTQKKGGKYINKLLRLQPAELKVENKRRKEKIYGFA